MENPATTLQHFCQVLCKVPLGSYTLADINTMSTDDFFAKYLPLFNSGRGFFVLKQANRARPFPSLDHFWRAVDAAMVHTWADAAEACLILRDNDQLGSQKRAQVEGAEGKKEHASVGLSSLSMAQQQEFAELNQLYLQKHGFPFMLAVAGLNAATILHLFKERLACTPHVELANAITQYRKLVGQRFNKAFASTPGSAAPLVSPL